MINFNSMEMPLVITSCLILGHILKNYFTPKVKNIPLIMAMLGVGLSILIYGFISIEKTIIYGALNGLVSTGLYETFKNFIKDGNPKND